jgi:hypothetical protein
VKKKYFLVVLFLTLAIFLSGCGGIVTPATDEANVKSVLNEYFLAINDLNWGKAKGYCVYGSDQYYSTSGFEDAANLLEQYYGSVNVTCFTNISNVSVDGSDASAFVSINLVVTAGYDYASDSISGNYYLQKIGNNWKIYDGQGFE